MFFWVFPRRQVVVCRRFEILCQYIPHPAFKDGPDRCREHTQKNIYNIQNTVKV
jgi:hypothetical protein